VFIAAPYLTVIEARWGLALNVSADSWLRRAAWSVHYTTGTRLLLRVLHRNEGIPIDAVTGIADGVKMLERMGQDEKISDSSPCHAEHPL